MNVDFYLKKDQYLSSTSTFIIAFKGCRQVFFAFYENSQTQRFRIVAPKASYEASKQPPSAGVEGRVSYSSEVTITAPDKQPDRKEQQ